MDRGTGTLILNAAASEGFRGPSHHVVSTQLSDLSRETEVWTATRRWCPIRDEAGVAWDAVSCFDILFLNKRTGHLLLRLLTHHGSMLLASRTNPWDLDPVALREDDLVVQRGSDSDHRPRRGAPRSWRPMRQRVPARASSPPCSGPRPTQATATTG